MRPMSFPRSCAYAALSNLLADFGIDADDRQIVLEIGLPFMLRADGDAFLAGTMLQSPDWFNRYLMPRGLQFVQATIAANQLPAFLRRLGRQCMLGIHVEANHKHAVLYQHAASDRYTFWNNRHIGSQEPEQFHFSADELENRVDNPTSVGYLLPFSGKYDPPDSQADREQTLSCLSQYQAQMCAVWSQVTHTQEILKCLDSLFAAFFLDIPIMMGLLELHDLEREIISLRTRFLAELKQSQQVLLSQHIPVSDLTQAFSRYAAVIQSGKC